MIRIISFHKVYMNGFMFQCARCLAERCTLMAYPTNNIRMDEYNLVNGIIGCSAYLANHIVATHSCRQPDIAVVYE